MVQRYFFAFLFFTAYAGFAAAHPHHSERARALHLPKVGTIIINTYYVTDSSGAVVPKTKVRMRMQDDTLRVIRSGFRILGRSNCVEMVDRAQKRTALISYAKNGDLYLRTLGKDVVWNRLPFGLKPGTIIRKKLPNETGKAFFRIYSMPHSRTWEVLGTDTASCNGKLYRCIKLQVVDIRKYRGQDWREGTLYWYSPEIGYFIRSNFGWNGPYFLNQQLKMFRATK